MNLDAFVVAWLKIKNIFETLIEAVKRTIAAVKKFFHKFMVYNKKRYNELLAYNQRKKERNGIDKVHQEAVHRRGRRNHRGQHR